MFKKISDYRFTTLLGSKLTTACNRVVDWSRKFNADTLIYNGLILMISI